MFTEIKNSYPLLQRKRNSRTTAVIARQDRIPIWALPRHFIVIIGIGSLFTFFDIFDINVSFIQTCTQIVSRCTPENASIYLGRPVLLNLLGYVIGTLILSPLADKYGRRDLLFITLMLTGIGSLYTALVGDYTNFIVARTLTGIGVGADLALVNTYISEIAPNHSRTRYISLIFILSSLGAFLAVWLGLYLTTPATPFPLGLPFALATPTFTIGWRIMYMIGGLLAVIGLLLRSQLPESPRWLAACGRVTEAEQVVEMMEKYASSRSLYSPLPPIPVELPLLPSNATSPYGEIFGNAIYLKRTILLLVVWLVSYITVYSIAAGLTTLLVALHYSPPEAGLIVAIGTIGFVVSAFIAYTLGGKMERKYWLPVAALFTLLGGVVIAFSGTNFGITALGSIILFFGFNVWVPIIYTWSMENYPTRARTTGFALVDGIGHIGGGVGLTFIASLTSKLGPLFTFLLISIFLLMAACLAQFGTPTKGRRLDEIAP